MKMNPTNLNVWLNTLGRIRIYRHINGNITYAYVLGEYRGIYYIWGEGHTTQVFRNSEQINLDLLFKYYIK